MGRLGGQGGGDHGRGFGDRRCVRAALRGRGRADRGLRRGGAAGRASRRRREGGARLALGARRRARRGEHRARRRRRARPLRSHRPAGERRRRLGLRRGRRAVRRGVGSRRRHQPARHLSGLEARGARDEGAALGQHRESRQRRRPRGHASRRRPTTRRRAAWCCSRATWRSTTASLRRARELSLPRLHRDADDGGAEDARPRGDPRSVHRPAHAESRRPARGGRRRARSSCARTTRRS